MISAELSTFLNLQKTYSIYVADGRYFPSAKVVEITPKGGWIKIAYTVSGKVSSSGFRHVSPTKGNIWLNLEQITSIQEVTPPEPKSEGLLKKVREQ